MKQATSSMTERSSSIRLAPLDALRGFAALAVPTFTHFVHFGGDKSLYPYDHLAFGHWLYTYSQFFVDLFFVLSGFVLTYRYVVPLAREQIDGREFFFLRFSRLYPLHLLTLCTCAGVEWWLAAFHQPPVIYGSNDLYHFALHLGFLQLWFEHGLAYNYPSWSVCAEVFVYLLFFLYARHRPKYFAIAAGATVFVGIAVLTSWSLPLLNRNMARAMVGFFMGALAFEATEKLDRAGRGQALGASCLAALVTILVVANRIGYDGFIGGDPLPYGLILFPLLTVASLRVPPLARLLSLRPLTFLGDISYAVYLAHVPIQMIILAVTRAHRVTIPTSSPGFFWAWIATLVVVGTVIHYGFERPARRWLRARLARETPVAAAVAPTA
jgi:peptidoglycan/LPS O-acetylase OafA/YrhL